MDEPEIAETFHMEIKAKWGEVAGTHVRIATHFAASVGFASAGSDPDGIYLTFGHLQPPVLLGTPEEVTAQLSAGLTVEIQGRYLLTRARLSELMGILEKVAGQYDAVAGRKEEDQ